MVGRHLVDSRKIAVRYIGREYSFYSVTNSPGEEIGAKLLKYEPILAVRVI